MRGAFEIEERSLHSVAQRAQPARRKKLGYFGRDDSFVVRDRIQKNCELQSQEHRPSPCHKIGRLRKAGPTRALRERTSIEGEEVEVAFAGENDGEIFAVGSDGEVAGDAAVEDGIEVGLRDGDFMAGGWSRERRNVYPAHLGGFALGSAL